MHPLQSDQIDQLMLSLSMVHKEQGVLIEKDAEGFKWKYASQDIIIDTIRKRCSPYGLVLSRRTLVFDKTQYLETQLYHVPSKQFIRGLSLLYVDPSSDKPDQVWGGSLTYHSRYDALSIVGMVAADDPADNDGTRSRESSEGSRDRTMNILESDNISEAQLGLLKSKLRSQPELEKSIMAQYNIQSLANIPKRSFNSILGLFGPKQA